MPAPKTGSAKQMLMRSRLPIADLIAKQKARLDDLDDRIGRLMTRRADAEEVLADLYTALNSSRREGV
jgi:hypothetical protein